jgi:predicted membrane metal-binding protein
MNALRQNRGWTWVAIVAISIAVLLLLVPHGHSTDSGAWIALLPVLFAGVISPLSLLSPLAYLYLGRTPDAPALPASFQRPPPFSIA